MSRYPNSYSEMASLSLMSEEDTLEELIVARIGIESNEYFLISIERVEEETTKDEIIQTVIKYVVNGFPDCKQDMKVCTEIYWRFR